MASHSKKTLNIQTIVLIFVIVALLMISSALIELQQSKKEILSILTGQAHSLLESISIASENTLRTTQYLDELIREKRLDFQPLDSRYLAFKRQLGFGNHLRNVVLNNSQIMYAALQDTSHILAAAGDVSKLEAIEESDFLLHVLRDSIFANRVTQPDSLEIFEAVHPFTFDGTKIGLLRLGLSMEPIARVNQRIYRRLVIISIVLIAIGGILFTFIFTRQKYQLLREQYAVVETYSSNIIGNVSDGIIVTDGYGKVKIFNRASENIFQVSMQSAVGKPIENVLPSEVCPEVHGENGFLKHIKCSIRGQLKYLLVSKSIFESADFLKNQVLVIRDLTEEKLQTQQQERRERLTAMGELASGVAHEIRNPLNTISTIVQQLDKDFEPQTGMDEYHQLMRLVYDEVQRINRTVRDFLRFSRPEPVSLEAFYIKPFLESVVKQFESTAQKQGARLNLDINWDGEVIWDEKQMRQVLINLVQNSLEAFEKNTGTIDILLNRDTDDALELIVRDDGPGIPQNIRANIFNLYFTTKARGTGIGLSVVQRIIYEHGGLIQIDDSIAKGTAINMRIPVVAGIRRENH